MRFLCEKKGRRYLSCVREKRKTLQFRSYFYAQQQNTKDLCGTWILWRMKLFKWFLRFGYSFVSIAEEAVLNFLSELYFVCWWRFSLTLIAKKGFVEESYQIVFLSLFRVCLAFLKIPRNGIKNSLFKFWTCFGKLTAVDCLLLTNFPDYKMQ